MIIKFKNKTSQKQEIFLINGGAFVVPSGQEVSIDEDKIYKEELERANKFFEIEKYYVKRQKTTKYGGKK